MENDDMTEAAEQAALTKTEIDAVCSTIEMELHPCASQERAHEIADYVRNVVEKEVLAPAWEPLTPERLERLQLEPLHTKYWLACKQYHPEPVIAATKLHAGRVYFGGEEDVYDPEQISHIMPFITPEMPKA